MTAPPDAALEILHRANPHPRERIADPSTDPRAQAMLAEILAASPPPRRVARTSSAPTSVGWRVIAPVLSLIVVAAVVVVVLHARGDHRSVAVDGAAASEIVLRLQPSPEVPRVTSAAVTQEITILRDRVKLLGVGRVPIVRDGNEVIVRSPEIASSAMARALLTRDPQITFTDWEQNVITPNDRTDASELLAQNPKAVLISQGRGGPVGTPAAGAMTLYAAVKLASRQPAQADVTTQTRRGAQSFAFAPASSARCAASHVPCLVGGPSTSATMAAEAARRSGVAHPIVLTVHQGTLVVRASEPGLALRADYRDTHARYYVMHDDAALTGLDLRRITASTDSAGQPDVTGHLTAPGRRAFQALTATVAHRGSKLRLGRAANYQHFAVVVDGTLVTVPQINYDEYPDGVIGPSGIEIDGDLTRAQDAALANTLRLGTLPLRLAIAPVR